jgi:hypothetical protein
VKPGLTQYSEQTKVSDVGSEGESPQILTVEAELVSRVRLPTWEVAKTTLFEYLEALYHRKSLIRRRVT